MRGVLLLLLTLCIASLAQAAEPIILSTSPSGRLAVAIYSDPEFNDTKPGDDTTVYLIEAATKKRIGPLEEVDADGGGFAKPSENVEPTWSKDSKFLTIYYRCGRHSYDSLLYRIEGRRAIPVHLPDPSTHPKGKLLKQNMESSRSYSALSWRDEKTLVKSHSGSGYGDVEFIYKLRKDGTFVLDDIQ